MSSWRSSAWLRCGFWGLAALASACSRSLPDRGKSAPASASSPPSVALPIAASPALLVANVGPGSFELRAARPVQVATIAQFEQRTADGGWLAELAPEGAPGYPLRQSCSENAPAPCRSLSAGETLVPIPWSGEDCAWQCGKPCEQDERFRSGVHRLVVTACTAPHERFEGPAFEMPRSAKALARLRTATGVDQVRAARLEPGTFKLPYDPNEPGRSAGYKEISGTSQQLSPALSADLLQWLRANTGFNDDLVKRCAPGPSVSFVLTRSAPAPAQRSDIGLDLNCARLDVFQNGEDISFSFFDSSREQLLGILSRVFPNDRQLKRVIERQLLALARQNDQLARPRAVP